MAELRLRRDPGDLRSREAGASADPLRLLMACFPVRRFGEDEAAASAAGVTGA